MTTESTIPRRHEPPRGVDADDTLLRWRLVLGPEGHGGGSSDRSDLWGEAERRLHGDQRLGGVDRALDFLYGPGDGPRGAGLEASLPYVPTWLGDIRRYFPRETVAFLERDAIERRGLRQLLMEPEVL